MRSARKLKIHFEPAGAIFDLDDTLLDNRPGNKGHGFHERSRLAAAREVGQRHNIFALKTLSIAANIEAFASAPASTLEAAVWNILVMVGHVDGLVIDPENMLFQEIIARKHALYRSIIEKKGKEIRGARRFVNALAARGLEGRMAIASNAIRRDVDIFLKNAKLSAFFPADKIWARESIVNPKPNPEVFDKAFSALALPERDRHQVCAFEDDPRGIAAARAAGLFVCAIGTRYSPTHMMALEVPPNVAFSSYAEFTRYFGFAGVNFRRRN